MVPKRKYAKVPIKILTSLAFQALLTKNVVSEENKTHLKSMPEHMPDYFTCLIFS